VDGTHDRCLIDTCVRLVNNLRRRRMPGPIKMEGVLDQGQGKASSSGGSGGSGSGSDSGDDGRADLSGREGGGGHAENSVLQSFLSIKSYMKHLWHAHPEEVRDMCLLLHVCASCVACGP